jgi:hypothetical protein
MIPTRRADIDGDLTYLRGSVNRTANASAGAIEAARARRQGERMKRTLQVVAGVIALYAGIRGVAELFLIDYRNPASYRQDWGGPSLAGVLAVHTGPGLAVLLGAFLWLRRLRPRIAGTLGKS